MDGETGWELLQIPSILRQQDRRGRQRNGKGELERGTKIFRRRKEGRRANWLSRRYSAWLEKFQAAETTNHMDEVLVCSAGCRMEAL